MPSSDLTRDPHEDQQSAAAVSSVRFGRENSAASSLSSPDSTAEGDNPLRSIFSGVSKLTGRKQLSKKRK